MTDIVSDTLARLKNATLRRREVVEVMNTKMSKGIVDILSREGFVGDIEEDGRMLKVALKYDDDDQPVATTFIKVSKPGQKIYVSTKEIVPVLNGRGISIISTSSGLMTGAQAKSKKLGGEYICKVW